MTIIMSAIACKPELKVVGSWQNKEKVSGRPYGSVFIMVLTANLETRTVLETELATAATAHGIKSSEKS